jgi:hypothetical protein
MILILKRHTLGDCTKKKEKEKTQPFVANKKPTSLASTDMLKVKG